jgi:hypothetical protein
MTTTTTSLVENEEAQRLVCCGVSGTGLQPCISIMSWPVACQAPRGFFFLSLSLVVSVCHISPLAMSMMRWNIITITITLLRHHNYGMTMEGEEKKEREREERDMDFRWVR